MCCPAYIRELVRRKSAALLQKPRAENERRSPQDAAVEQNRAARPEEELPDAARRWSKEASGRLREQKSKKYYEFRDAMEE